MRGIVTGRRRSIKVKIFILLLIPLVSLVAIWGYAATIVLRSGHDLLIISTVHEHVTVPTRALASALQRERQLSLAFLGDRTASDSALNSQRLKTDASRTELERLTQEAKEDIPAPLWERIVRLLAAADRLTEARSEVNGRTSDRLQTLDAYSAVIETANEVFEKLRTSADIDLIDQVRATAMVGRSREMMSRQAALIAGVDAAGVITSRERARFAELATSRELLFVIGTKQLDDELRAHYTRMAGSAAYAEFERIEEAFSNATRPDPSWVTASVTLTETFDRTAGGVAQAIADRSGPMATGILIQIGIAGGLGLVAVTASIFISVRFGRRIGVELVGLQHAALDLADRRLPDVVARLRKGEDVCPVSETPELHYGTTAEIVRVGEAFSSVQRTAVQAAVGQAELRKGVGKVFVNLARRNQSLLHRQLAMLEAMERRATDPETLEDLFALDHLTTRMRRHAEGLIILSGSVPGRGWRRPVAIYDVVRAAVEEVEDYRRVTVEVPHGPALAGAVVTDVVHLVAELVENATIFSPPNTVVRVHGEPAARGYAIEVEDRGLGMKPAEMAELNARLAEPPEFDLADSDRLGLFVVGMLAARHGIRVSLRPSPFGGTSAIVLIPDALVTEMPLPAADHPAGTGPVAAAETRETPPAPVSEQRLAPVAESAALTAGRTAGTSGTTGISGTTGSGLPRRVRRAVPGQAPPQAAAPDSPPLRVRQADDGGADGPGGSGAPAEPSSVLTSFRAGWLRAEEEGDGR
ncbi:nitrate- and nitrite sensing domain-containing protein [Planomonospora corallina]|uniref:histidine kinase n=1 Tax=Planomonospora corallina TaxID=1806052 RepID=A0ABV8IAB7_9ACTN